MLLNIVLACVALSLAGSLVTVVMAYGRKLRGLVDDNVNLSDAVKTLECSNAQTLKAEQAAERREKWRATALASADNICLAYAITPEGLPGRFTEVGDVACSLLEYGRDELLAMSPLDVETFREPSLFEGRGDAEFLTINNAEGLVGDNKYAQRNMEALMRRILKERRVCYEGGYVSRSGRLFPVTVTATCIDLDGESRVVCYASDQSKLRKQTAEAKVFERLLRDLLATSDVGVAIYTADKQLQMVNTTFLRMFGCPEESEFGRFGLFKTEFLPEATRNRMNRGESMRFKMTVDFYVVTKKALFTTSRSGNGYFDMSIANLGVEKDFSGRGYLVQAQDVTALRRMEQEMDRMGETLRQAKKMEAIGTLAGGIAHDFNNILTPILGYAELGQDLCPEGSQLREFLQDIQGSALRAKELVEQILVFSRRGETTGIPMKLTPVVKEVAKQMEASAPRNVKVRCSVRTKDDKVLSTPTQIHQVLMNVCSNAVYVMREQGGELDIGLSSFVLGHTHKREFPSLATRKYLRGDRRQRYVRLSVRDTGPGMDEEMKAAIFEPFFTTKPSGEGTGMGLALVHGIVTTLGGAIRVDSEPGKGTTFHVALPVAAEKEDAGAADALSLVEPGSGCVLFVDDEVAIVQMAEIMLSSLGYEPVVSARSREALELFKKDPGRFDVVITDQVMPEMTGAELIRELLSIRPDLPIVLCTGFSEKFPREHAEAAGIREFVMKPIERRDLAAAIHRALAGDPAPVKSQTSDGAATTDDLTDAPVPSPDAATP